MSHAPIARLENPSAEQLRACIREHRPVILTGLMAGQPASRLWDTQYLKSKLGARPVKVVSHDKPKLFWDPRHGLPARSQPFDRFVESTFERKDGGYSYLQDDVNSLPAIQDDYA